MDEFVQWPPPTRIHLRPGGEDKVRWGSKDFGNEKKELTLNVVYAWKFREAAKQDDFIYVCANTHNCCLSKQVFPQNSGSFDHLLWALYYMHNIQSQF